MAEKTSLKEAIRNKQGSDDAPTPESSSQGSSKSAWSKPITIGGPGLKQTMIFCRQLSTLLNVGMSLQRSLQILSERTNHPQLRDVVKSVYNDIEGGTNFSTALEKHPKIFSPLFVNVVKIGEVGGILESSLARLTEILESKVALKRKIRSASMYPIVVLFIVLIVVSIILLSAVPEFKSALEDVPQDSIHPITAFVFGLSDFMVDSWFIVYGGLAVAFFVIWTFFKTAGGKRVGEALMLSIPKLRSLPVNIALSRATRSLGSLMTAGIPLLESIKVTANSSESYKMRESLIRVHESLETGGKFETPLRQEEVMFPPMITDMISVGEEAGALDTMLLNIADNCENEVDTTIDGLQSILEPLLILVMGFIVLFVAIALFLPYFEIYQAIE